MCFEINETLGNNIFSVYVNTADAKNLESGPSNTIIIGFKKNTPTTLFLNMHDL